MSMARCVTAGGRGAEDCGIPLLSQRPVTKSVCFFLYLKLKKADNRMEVNSLGLVLSFLLFLFSIPRVSWNLLEKTFYKKWGMLGAQGYTKENTKSFSLVKKVHWWVGVRGIFIISLSNLLYTITNIILWKEMQLF